MRLQLLAPILRQNATTRTCAQITDKNSKIPWTTPAQDGMEWADASVSTVDSMVGNLKTDDLELLLS